MKPKGSTSRWSGGAHLARCSLPRPDDNVGANRARRRYRGAAEKAARRGGVARRGTSPFARPGGAPAACSGSGWCSSRPPGERSLSRRKLQAHLQVVPHDQLDCTWAPVPPAPSSHSHSSSLVTLAAHGGEHQGGTVGRRRSHSVGVRLPPAADAHRSRLRDQPSSRTRSPRLGSSTSLTPLYSGATGGVVLVPRVRVPPLP